MKPAHLFYLAVLTPAAVGCTSISSTHIERAKDVCGWKLSKMHGIPTTLRVPHHFKISVVDEYYEKNGNLLRDMSCQQGGQPPLLKTQRVDTVVEYTEEIFTVDFARPAAGVLDTTVALDSQTQYFTSIDNKLQDKTIKDITAAIGTLSAALNPVSGGDRTRGLKSADKSINQHDRVVAVTYVDVSDPQAVTKIHEFLCQHLNGCHKCEPTPPSPAVATKPLAPVTPVTVGQP